MQTAMDDVKHAFGSDRMADDYYKVMYNAEVAVVN